MYNDIQIRIRYAQKCITTNGLSPGFGKALLRMASIVKFVKEGEVSIGADWSAVELVTGVVAVFVKMED